MRWRWFIGREVEVMVLDLGEERGEGVRGIRMRWRSGRGLE